jgi:hypothetical protein
MTDPHLMWLAHAAAVQAQVEAAEITPAAAFAELAPAFDRLRPCTCAREYTARLERYGHRRAELNNPHSRPTPQSTIEAILYVVRQRGVAALKEPATAARIQECDAEARKELKLRIKKLQKAEEQ